MKVNNYMIVRGFLIVHIVEVNFDMGDVYVND